MRSFAAEERKHGVLCGAVVEALGGQALAPALEVVPFPNHDEVSLLEGALRNLISISCLSETIAVALIGAEREEMPEGELKTLLTTIYAEECGHANYGWRLLPKLLAMGDDTLLDCLSEYLLVAFAHLGGRLAHLLQMRPRGGSHLVCAVVWMRASSSMPQLSRSSYRG